MDKVIRIQNCLEDGRLPHCKWDMLSEKAAQSLMKGKIIGVPTDTIYGIAAIAQSTKAVKSIYEIKQRHNEKPVAICVADVSDIYRWCEVTVAEDVLNDLLPGPVTLVFKRKLELNPGLNPSTELVGVRIPDHEFIRGIARYCKQPIALTSANISAAQSCLQVKEFEYLWPKLDLVFDGGCLGNMEQSRLGSTVVDLSTRGQYKIIRDGSALTNVETILREKYHFINQT